MTKGGPKSRSQAFSLKEATTIRKLVITSGVRPTCPRCARDLVLDTRVPPEGGLMPVWELRCESCQRSLVVPGFPNQDQGRPDAPRKPDGPA